MHTNSDIPTGQFVAERLIRFSHCDPAGIVFFPRYFELLNGVVEDWWAHIGKPWTETVSERRMGTPTAQIDTTFVAPSHFGETVRFELSVTHVGNSSLHLTHRIVGPDGGERVRFEQRMVATSLDTHRPMPWPEDIRQAIHGFKEKS
ncbi:acyl-CoA thioesterase [Nitrogeniibacter aestuarii]|uniref:acyl-CoA thioesterase n=1 Tax=Nitrogeniibacter aestuarii TaxID=2815343 RepID=UPI001E365F91|nr:thioesterase family protein [Nitrogeniibacter aestuarii]